MYAGDQNGRHEENGLRTLVNGKVEFKRVVQTPRVQRNPWRAPHILLGLSLTNNQNRNEDYGGQQQETGDKPKCNKEFIAI